MHKRLIHPLDQGDIGSCTGNACVGCLETVPLTTELGRRLYNETTAVAIYSKATHLDPSGGTYPPLDPGSTGLDACAAAKAMGYLRAYHHAFGLNDVLATSQEFALMIGSNWYDSFDQPSDNGMVIITPNASVRGGHEWEMSGIVDPQSKIVKCWNSWGSDYGDGGAFYMTFETLDRLLSEQGDATVPVT